MSDQVYRTYFEAEAEQWMDESYKGDASVYPTAEHRARIVLRHAGQAGRSLRIADLGCGGGGVSIPLARAGHTVVGVDRSEAMLELARDSTNGQDAEVAARLEFKLGDVLDPPVDPESFDMVIAMGLIGYLEDESLLFQVAYKLLADRGELLVSCRNRLFNLNSLSWRTRREFGKDDIDALLAEMEGCYKPVSNSSLVAFLARLDAVVRDLREQLDDQIKSGDDSPASAMVNLFEPAADRIEARQQTPALMAALAKANGFGMGKVWGVHPHMLDPNANGLLPAGAFVAFSKAMEALDEEPVSLAWSSVFIGQYVKR
ncbi:MAG: hypothetical protein TEF_17295 [Rhizobiales bacterium NRL2]|jgi:SAM-dependent methyltransferase|nr:MAG: hypothetical protein TEF_17295 [Rhizobiales bacterium NRL2]